MSTILSNPHPTYGHVTRTSSIFGERLQPWAAEKISGYHTISKAPRVLAALMDWADEDGFVKATYRQISLACDVGQPAICHTLHHLVADGILEKHTISKYHGGTFRLTCLRRGAE
jgi:hypothetical protein